jgi:hypothetical protein
VHGYRYMNYRCEQLQRILQTATENLSSEDQLRWHPEGKWCAAEILEHLYLTYTGTIKGFERVLEQGKPLASSPSLRHRLRTGVAVGLGYMPSGREAPKQVVPRGLPAEKVRSEIFSKIAAMDELMTRCEAQFGGSKVLDHTILGPLNVSGWRKFHLLHGRHHARQIVKLRDQMKSKPDSPR